MADISDRRPVPKNNFMKKIICIGECSLNIVLDAEGNTLGTIPGGRIANAAAIMGREGFKVLMASDVCADAIGDIIVSHLTSAGVDVTSVDRFTEGQGAVNIYVCDKDDAAPEPSMIRYESYPEDAFDIVWPRIDEGDIVVFGGAYALDARMKQGMGKLLAYAKERKAILVYLPGFINQQKTNITRVMPALLDNFELADVMVTRNRDLEAFFGVKTPDACYHDHIDFYCRSLVNIDCTCHRISYYSGKEVSSVELPAGVCSTMMGNAGAVAGLVSGIAAAGLSAAQLDTPGADIRENLLRTAAKTAMKAAEEIKESWQSIE